MKRFRISKGEANISLLNFLKGKVDLSVRGIKRILEGGGVRLNGKIERFGTKRLRPSDLIELDISQSERERGRIEILYECEGYAALNKGVGIVTSDDEIRKVIPRGRLVHRLDRETSGVLIVAKDRSVQKAFERQFYERLVEKIYLALVSGQVRRDGGVIDNLLAPKGSFHGQTLWGSTKSISKGQRALTRWECDYRGQGYSRVWCFPETGKTHQIRVHMAEMGHPILGDLQYGRHAKFPPWVKRLMLHSHKITFTDPLTEELMTIEAPVPCEFKVKGRKG